MQVDEGIAAREQKLEALKALGLPCLPDRFGPTCPSADIKDRFEALDGDQVRVAGRLMRVRLMGKAAFAHILDREGEIQLYFKRDVLGEPQYEYFKLLDIGDVIGVEGTVFKTKTGEVTIQAETVVLLAKSYRVLPDKFHGLADVEVRSRQRYLDLIANPDSRTRFRIRTRVISAIRRFLDERGYMEVETPILQPLYGGGAATPFTTDYAALDMRAYLRIADELYLKRLIVGGLERVYEISKDFRNEAFSRKHSPEFTMLELYEAYADYEDIMRLTEEMVAAAAREVLGTTDVAYGEEVIHLAPPWKRISIQQSLVEHAEVDFSTMSRDELLSSARAHNVDVAGDATRGKIVEEMVSALVEPKLEQPTFLIDFPVDFPGSLLAKRRPDDPDVVYRFEAYMAGMEFANAFSELNDPFDQAERMEASGKLSGEEHNEVDRDFILALEHGMPPTGGLGVGLDRLVMVLANAHHIRETILFPLHRPRQNA